MVEVKQGEISLLDLWNIIVAQRRLLLVVWVICVLLAIAYVMFTKPVYQATAYLLPPTQKDVQALNIQALYSNSNSRSFQVSYTPEQVYQLLLQTLRSRASRQKFYDANHITDQLNDGDKKDDMVFEKLFHQKLQVLQDVKDKENKKFVEVSFEGESAALSTAWVNAFIAQSARQTRDILISDVSAKAKGLIQSLQAKIDSKLTMAKQRRLDRIAKLKEALRVAKVISQKDKQVIRTNGLSMMADEVPLYLLGESALQAELSMLMAREDEAPFVQGLRDMQEKIKVLQGLNIDEASIHPMLWDQKAIVPEKPIKPKKMLIIILAGLVGLMLGVMLAFIKNAMSGKDNKVEKGAV
ncbi:MAG: Wzz/FepE/Etk N-terminal domain-containing protein [Ghiorsea sp.]|nr:Wzz/FepE/Etk N-terminal domain-containing protein [Ghiorsea sp.]